MAAIYQYSQYNPMGLLRSFSQRSEEIVTELNILHGYYSRISASIRKMEDQFAEINSKLGEQRTQLSQTLRFCSHCLQATELSDTEEMINARSRILQRNSNK